MREAESSIQKGILEALAEMTKAQNAAIVVVVDENSMVTLKGNVPSAAARQEAQRIAEGQEGVAVVVNDLQVVVEYDDSEGTPPPGWIGCDNFANEKREGRKA